MEKGFFLPVVIYFEINRISVRPLADHIVKAAVQANLLFIHPQPV